MAAQASQGAELRFGDPRLAHQLAWIIGRLPQAHRLVASLVSRAFLDASRDPLAWPDLTICGRTNVRCPGFGALLAICSELDSLSVHMPMSWDGKHGFLPPGQEGARPSGGEVLAMIVQRCPALRLRRLRLTWCADIRPSGLEPLLRRWAGSLEELDVSGTEAGCQSSGYGRGLDVEGALATLEVLASVPCPNLRALDLRGRPSTVYIGNQTTPGSHFQVKVQFPKAQEKVALQAHPELQISTGQVEDAWSPAPDDWTPAPEYADEILDQVEAGACSVVNWHEATPTEAQMRRLSRLLEGDSVVEALWCHISTWRDEDFVILAKALQHNRAVRALDFGSNSIGRRGVLTLLEVLECGGAAALERAHFQGCSVPDEGRIPQDVIDQAMEFTRNLLPCLDSNGVKFKF